MTPILLPPNGLPPTLRELGRAAVQTRLIGRSSDKAEKEEEKEEEACETEGHCDEDPDTDEEAPN